MGPGLPPIKPMSVTRDFQNSIPVAVYKMNMDNFIDDCIRQKTGKNSNASVHKAVDSGKGKVDTCKGIMIEDTNVLPNKIDKDKWIMTEDTNVVPNRKAGRRNNGIVIEERVNHSVNESDSDSDSDRRNLFNASMEVDHKSEYSDKFVDFLSEAEEELIELRKRNSNVNMTPTAGKKPTKLRPSRPKRQYELGENDIIIEHKEFMDNLMCQLIDGDDGMTDPFQIFELKNEEFPIHDEDTHWKMRKPKVIARCVFRHEKLKEPEKGKQSKWKRYPSARVDESNYLWRCYGKTMSIENSFEAILDSNEGSTVKLGEILIVVGRDDNNHIFQIAWALVNVENKDNWSWFLELLGEDIGFGMSCLLEATTLRGGVVRGGVVRCGAMRGGRGRGGAVRDEIDVDETSKGESIETSKLQLLVVLTQLDVQGVNEQAEGSVRQANNVTQEASLNEQAPRMDPKNLQARNLVRPRPKSQRMLKKKFSTTHPGGGSSMTNTHDLE
ncbi:hypothetical protein Tco_0386944 [Tanacetum coccineum]